MMKASWPCVPLGEVMRLSLDAHVVDPEKEYPNLGIYNFGRGAFRKPPIQGCSTSAKTLYKVRSGQFIYSRLFAFEGAYTVVPDALDGLFVSNEFPTFDLNPMVLDAGYLRWLFCQRPVWHKLRSDATGMGDRRQRIHPEQILDYSIPLPPLPEQRRTAAQLDASAATIASACERVSSINSEALQACRNLVSASPGRGGRVCQVGDVMRLRSVDVKVSPEETYSFAGVYSFGRGLFRSGRKRGSDFSYQALTRLRSGDFTYPKLMAWEGALGVVPPECDGTFVSPEFPVFEINRELLRPEVADIYFRDPKVWPTLSQSSAGTNVRRRRLNPEAFLALPVPVPSRADQDRLSTMLCHTRRLQELAITTKADLLDLLPSLLHRAFGGEFEPTLFMPGAVAAE